MIPRLIRQLAIVLFAVAATLAHAARDINIGLQAAITSMDPHYHNLSPNNSMMQHMFEGLIRRDDNQKLVLSLATAWRAIDELTWEFKLRKNVRFHDGTPFTAEESLECRCISSRAWMLEICTSKIGPS